MHEGDSFFKGRRAVLLTKHRKEQVIKTVLEKALGCHIIVEAGFDTDSFGTFTRQINRPGSQLETARLKAIKGMELTGMDMGLASEGSFSPHPLIPFLPWNLEIVLLSDKRENLEIIGEYAGSETNYSHILTAGFPEARDFALKAGFPEHWLVLRPDNDRHRSVIKNINTWEHLEDAVKWGLGKSATGKIFLETDMRAHANPTRMINIGKATENLVKKIKQKCPRCGVPGFSVVERKRGLPCEWCERPTKEIKASVFACRRCGFSKEEAAPGNTKAPAGRCQHCNP